MSTSTSPLLAVYIAGSLAVLVLAGVALFRACRATRRRDLLETLVSLRTGELHRANTDLDHERDRAQAALLGLEKLETLGIIAGGVAHDLRNLLTGIAGTLDLVGDDLPRGHSTQLLIQEAKKAAMRAGAITEQLLAVSKGGAPIRPASSLTEIIKDSARFMLFGSGVSCSFHIPDDLWMCDVDLGQLSQVLQNLVINARQAMPGGGTITVIGANEEAGGGSLPTGRWVRLDVIDQGTGIPEELLQQIFAPYFTTKQEGSGLGLALCASIVHKHGGEITVSSKTGRGSTFTILLPASREQSAATVEEQIPNSSSAMATLLVMDDEELVLRVSEKMLSTLGYQVLTARDGGEAVSIYRNRRGTLSPVDAVILDEQVPAGMGGVDAARKILEMDPAAKILLCTGGGISTNPSSNGTPGIRGRLFKPYLQADLIRVLSGLL